MFISRSIRMLFVVVVTVASISFLYKGVNFLFLQK